MDISSEIRNLTICYVKKQLEDTEKGHDWWHIYRVWQTAIHIAQEEGAELLTVALASLLHDIADPKFHSGDENLGPDMALNFMKSIGVKTSVMNHVTEIIKYMSFKNSFELIPFDSLEMRIVQDADRLDAMGAIGIARAFCYGGFSNQTIYDPEIRPNLKMTKEQYKNSKGPTINHFYEKLLLLKDRMNTEKGKIMAEDRHTFMLTYLDQFYDEWSRK